MTWWGDLLMGRHMRHHWTTDRQTAAVHPDWTTIDREPTRALAVTLARCRDCGGSLRAVAGGGWVEKLTNSLACVRRPRWFGGLRVHRLDCTPLDAQFWPPIVLVVGVVLIAVLAIVLAVSGVLGS